MLVANRRAFTAGMVAALAALPTRAADLSITDMLGRVVALPRAPRRILLLEARDLLTMALFHPKAAELVVGWAAVDRFDSDLLKDSFERSAGYEIAVVGKQTADTLSVESIVSLEPDLVVSTAFMAPGGSPEAAADKLGQFGIPLVFSDAASNAATEAGLAQTQRMALAARLRMWGQIFGMPRRADEIISFAEERLDAVARRVAGAPAVKTYLEIMSLYDECCWAAGTRIWGEWLAAAGGRSLDGLDAPWTAKLSTEQLMAQQPDVYIAMGGGYASATRPAIGPGLDPDAARRGLKRLTERTGFASLPAVQAGRVHGIWTGLITVPFLNVVFIELAGKWLHPEACRDLDPAATLAEINRRFLAEPVPGPLWANIGGATP